MHRDFGALPPQTKELKMGNPKNLLLPTILETEERQEKYSKHTKQHFSLFLKMLKNGIGPEEIIMEDAV